MALPLTSPVDHFDLLHADQVGTAIIWEKQSRKPWLKLEPANPLNVAVLTLQHGEEDRYLSVNEFRGWRRISLLKALRAMYIDIDAATGTPDLQAALDLLETARMPAPTVSMLSGRGLHLYWHHSPVPAQALPVWQACMAGLFQALAPLNPDPACKDATRVLRLAGTVNSKSRSVVTGQIFDKEPYDFHHLCDEVLGYRPAKPANQSKPATVHDFGGEKAKRRGFRGNNAGQRPILSWWHALWQDLQVLADYHVFGIPEGHRGNWVFIAACSLSWFYSNPQALEDDIVGWARTHAPGLTVTKVRASCKEPIRRAVAAMAGEKVEWRGEQRDPRYWYKRETLYKLFQAIIPADLEASGKLRVLISAETRKKHKQEADAARCTGQAAGRPSLNAPWLELGISRRTYFRRKALGTL